MQDKEKNKDTQKQPYEKPRLRKIQLAAEEVLSSGCKTAPGAFGAFIGNGCTNPVCSMATGS